MADQDNDQKTEEPSEKRLADSHEEGQFAKAPEVAVVVSLGAALAAFSFSAQSGTRLIGEFSVGLFGQLHRVAFGDGALPAPLAESGVVLALVLGPIVAACVVASLLAGGVQSGFQLTPKALSWKPERLDPIAGAKRIFSMRTLVHGGVDLLKLLAIGACLALAARSLLRDPLFDVPVETAYLGRFIHHTTLGLIARVLLALGVIAGISYAYERYKTHRDLKMTRQEVKDERKQAEGDALVKSALRRMARRLLQKQMLAAVPTADVIVTNPTHFAVALKYERGVDAAPVVLAKGDNRLAQRIKAIGAEHGVPTVENKPVARLLFATGRVGEPIPGDLYRGVAEILAFVYRTHRYYFFRLKSRRAAAGTVA